jgi:hypothetical protein
VLSVSTFGNTADIYAIVHLVPHACQHITVDPSRSSGDTVAKILTFTECHIWFYCLLAANQGNYVHGFFIKKTWRVSLSTGVRITMIRCVFYLLQIFKMFHGLMNNPILSSHLCLGLPLDLTVRGVQINIFLTILESGILCT